MTDGRAGGDSPGEMSIPEDYRREWTERVAAPAALERARLESAFLFRVGPEWLALPTAVCDRVVDSWTLHSLPHLRSEAVLGLGSIRGELILAVSLGALLGLPSGTAAGGGRMLVLGRDSARFAAPVDEVYGIHRYDPTERTPLPRTVAAERAFTIGLLPWEGRTVGFLDAERVLDALHRSLR